MALLNPADQALIEQSTDALRAALAERITWRWDDHHQAMLAEFSVDHEEAVWQTLLQHFPHDFDKRSIKQAAQKIKHLAGPYARLEKNQKLLCADTQGQGEVMLVWWPWGHGATVSVRAFRGDTSPFVEKVGLWQKLSKLFGRTSSTA